MADLLPPERMVECKELADQLRDVSVEDWSEDGAVMTIDAIDDLTAHITAQAERIAALEDALKPFAALAEHIFEGEPDDKALIACLAEPDDDPDLPVFTIGEIRRARTVLKGE